MVFNKSIFGEFIFSIRSIGIKFIEKLPNLEGYMVDKNGMATMTSNFNNHVV